MLNITSERKDNTTILHFKGNLNNDNAKSFYAGQYSTISDTNVVFDLSDVDSMDGTGLMLLSIVEMGLKLSKKKISVINAKGQPLKLMKTLNFGGYHAYAGNR